MPTDNTYNRDSAGLQGSDSLLDVAFGGSVQLAQAAASIGSISSLAGQATITRATGEVVQAEIGTPVFQDDTFETAGNSGVGLSFNDGSSFSLGADARLVIDSFVYDAGGADSSMVMNLAQGAFSFVSGQVAKTGDNNMTIITPTATIGIRGTAGAGDDDEVVLLQEPGLPPGEMVVTTQGGTVSLTTPNAYTNTANPLAPPTPPVPRSLNEIQSQFGGALGQLPVSLPANQNLPGSSQDDDGDGGEDAATDESGATGEGEEGQGEEDQGGESANGEDVEDGEEDVPDEEESLEDEGDLEGEGEEEGEGTPGDGENDDEESAEGEGGDDAGDDFADAGEDPGFGSGIAAAGFGPPPSGPPDENGSEEDQDEVLDQFGFGNKEEKKFEEVAGSDEDIFDELVETGPPPPPGPDEEEEEEEDDDDDLELVEPPPEGAVNIIPVTGSQSVTLTPGNDQIEISGASSSATVNGTFEAGDSVIDVDNAGSQQLTIVDVTSHTLSINGIENVLFGNMTGSELHTISVGGTQPIAFNTVGGPFDAVISGDGLDNLIKIGVAISAPSDVTVNLQAGNDEVEINTTQTVTLTLNNTETVSSSLGGSQDVVMANAISGVSFDLGDLGDADSLTLFNGTNNITVSDIQTVNGGTGNDTVNVGSTILQTLSLGAGIDTVNASGVASFNATNLADVENFIGSAGVDNIPLGAALVSGSNYNGGTGTDTLNLFTASTNFASITNFQNIAGGASNESLTLEAAVSASFNTIVDLGAGTGDALVLSGAGANTLDTQNVELITGGSANDTVTLRDFLATDIDLGAGTDEVILNGGPGTLTMNVFDNIETVTGGLGDAETIDLSGIGVGLSGTLFNLGLLNDSDSILLGNQGNSLSITELSSLTSGTGSDSVTMAALTAGTIDLGAGFDSVNASSQASSTISTLSNVESFIGTNGTDNITLGSLLTSGDDYNGQADGDSDVLNLVAGANTATIDHFETINGSIAADTLTLENQIFAAFGTTVDMQGGVDNLNLSASDDSLTLANVENLNSGAGADTIGLSTALISGDTYDGDVGSDTLNLLAASSNTASILNFEFVAGAVGTAETLVLENAVTGLDLDFGDLSDGNSLLLANGTNNITVSDISNITGGAGNDTLLVNNANTAVTIDAGIGSDTVTNFSNTNAVFTLSNVEQYNGGATGNDVLTMLTNLSGGGALIGGGAADADVLNLFGGTNSHVITFFETINGTAGTDDLTLQAAVGNTAVVVDLLGGTDTLNLGGVNNTLTVTNVEFFNGGTGDDNVSLGSDLVTGSQFSAGVGTDALTLLANSTNFSSLADFETVSAGAGTTESLTLEAILTAPATFDFGDFADGDTLDLADGGNTLSISDLANFIGGGGDDIVTMLTALQVGSSYNAVGGGDDNDSLILLDNSTNSAFLDDFEAIGGNSTTGTTLTFEAGSGINTTFTFTGAGSDTLNFSNGNNNATLNGVENVNGGTGTDIVTVNDTTGGTFALGDGGDTVTGAVGVADIFAYLAQGDADVAEGETINNFEIGTDKIDIFAISGGTLNYIGGAAFSNGSGNFEARFEDANTLQFDANDDGVADMEITLANGIAGSISATDFIDTP